MDEIKNIRKMYFADGCSISLIAQKTNYDRKTIRKYIDKNSFNINAEIRTKSNSKLDPYKPIIDKWLENDKKRRKKQRHTAKRVYDRLVYEYKELGYNCSYRSVALYVSSKKKELYSGKEGYLPLEHPPGEAQVDFGSAEFIENGILCNGHYLTVSFPYSNAGFIQLFKGETFECLAQGLKNIYMHIGGVPYKQWFDNGSSMVIKVLKNHKRKLREPFIRFIEHHNFEAVFCNTNAGHEKGSVENKVGYSRRNLLVPIPEFKDINEFNRSLLKMCETDMMRKHYKKEETITNLFKEDVKEFLPLPNEGFECSTYKTVHTDKYAKFTIDSKHTYSTKPSLANKTVTVKLSASYVDVLDEKMDTIVRHKRLFGDKKQESMKWIPYLSQLSRKPAALKYSGIYKMLPNSIQQWFNICENNEKKQALKLLAEITKESGFDTAKDTLEKALVHGAFDAESIKVAYRALLTDGSMKDKMPSVVDMKPINTNVSFYDNFLKKAESL